MYKSFNCIMFYRLFRIITLLMLNILASSFLYYYRDKTYINIHKTIAIGKHKLRNNN